MAASIGGLEGGLRAASKGGLDGGLRASEGGLQGAVPVCCLNDSPRRYTLRRVEGVLIRGVGRRGVER
eukprot:6562138-Pyramimonas_sp.AAC.1